MINQFLTTAEKDPTKIFLHYKNITYSYDEILNQIIHTARIINQYKIEVGSLIGIQLSNPLEFIINWFSCNYLGLISVLINPKLKNNELKTIINSVQLEQLITTRKNYSTDLIKSVNIIFNEDAPSISNCGNAISPYMWDNTESITIIFTSGSNAKPKPVKISILNFIASYQNWNNEINFTYNDTILNILPLHHIAGFSLIIRGLISNCTIILQDQFVLEYFIPTLNTLKITIVSLVPTMIYKLLENDEGIECLQSFRMILVGGGPASSALLEKCLNNNINIFIAYGMTETCSGVAGFWIKNYPNKLNSVGKPFKNLSLSTIKKDNQYSQICISGDNVANGYWKEPSFNSEFISCDLGKFDSDGFLYLKPHRSNRIITGGENVNPMEIEDVIKKMHGIVDCCVVGFEDQRWGEKIIAFIKTTKTINRTKLIEFCEERLLEYKIPKEFIICDEIPINELGKINRLKAEQILKDHAHI